MEFAVSKKGKTLMYQSIGRKFSIFGINENSTVKECVEDIRENYPQAGLVFKPRCEESAKAFKSMNKMYNNLHKSVANNSPVLGMIKREGR